MSNDPYNQGRSGGQPPSGPDYNEWWRGYQDHLKGLQQGDSGGSAGPLLGDDPNAEVQWPPPPRPVSVDETDSSNSPHGFTVDSGCAVLLLAALALLLLPLLLVTWMRLHPLSAAVVGAWFTGGS